MASFACKEPLPCPSDAWIGKGFNADANEPVVERGELLHHCQAKKAAIAAAKDNQKIFILGSAPFPT